MKGRGVATAATSDARTLDSLADEHGQAERGKTTLDAVTILTKD